MIDVHLMHSVSYNVESWELRFIGNDGNLRIDAVDAVTRVIMVDTDAASFVVAAATVAITHSCCCYCCHYS